MRRPMCRNCSGSLRLAPHRQQELQAVLRRLEQSGRIARTKGNRYIQSREADLIPGRIRINRQGKGFLQPDDPALKEIMIPQEATGTALHEDRVLVRRDVRAKGLRPDRSTGDRHGDSHPGTEADTNRRHVAAGPRVSLRDSR